MPWTWLYKCATSSGSELPFSFSLIIFMYGGVCMCVPDAWEVQKRAVNPLVLELQVVLSYHVYAGNWTWACGRTVSALNWWNHLSSPSFSFWVEGLRKPRLALLCSWRWSETSDFSASLPSDAIPGGHQHTPFLQYCRSTIVVLGKYSTDGVKSQPCFSILLCRIWSGNAGSFGNSFLVWLVL